jgi:hypothetical protein
VLDALKRSPLMLELSGNVRGLQEASKLSDDEIIGAAVVLLREHGLMDAKAIVSRDLSVSLGAFRAAQGQHARGAHTRAAWKGRKQSSTQMQHTRAAHKGSMQGRHMQGRHMQGRHMQGRHMQGRHTRATLGAAGAAPSAAPAASSACLVALQLGRLALRWPWLLRVELARCCCHTCCLLGP